MTDGSRTRRRAIHKVNHVSSPKEMDRLAARVKFA